jgi:hypothetical protein
MNPSLVDYLNSSGGDSSLTGRARLARERGFVSSDAEYMTLASQGKNADINTKLLNALRSGGPAPTPTTTDTGVPARNDQQFNPAGYNGVLGAAGGMNQNPMTGTQLEKSSALPEPTNFIDTTKVTPFSDRIGEVAKTTMGSAQFEIDTLRKQLQDMNAKDKERAQMEVDQLKGEVKKIVGTKEAQEALKASDAKFKVEENIRLYSDIQSKIVAAQEALNMGLIYEKDRPARMKFITGAESTLQKQGLATIGALQGTAAVIKGNLDLARAFGDATVNAINQDNERSFKALTTLLDLANNDLMDLKENERKIVNDRLSAIEKEADRLQKNKDDVLNLMITNPKAFLAGGVTLLDDKEAALRKMLPTMASDERKMFEADLAAKLAAANKGGKDGVDDERVKQDKALMLTAKAAGMPYEEAVNAFGDTLTIEYIGEVYGRKVPTSGVDNITNAYYNQFLDEKGQVKPGHTVEIDKNGKPVVKKVEADNGKRWWNPFSWNN